jgi:hypothetical protein
MVYVDPALVGSDVEKQPQAAGNSPTVRVPIPLWGFMKFVRRSIAVLAASVMGASILSACTHAHAPKTAAVPTSNPSQVYVANGAATTLALGDGARVFMGPGTTSGSGTLTATTRTNPGPAPSGLQQTGRVYEFALTGASIIKPISVTLPVTIPNGSNGKPGPDIATLAYYNAGARQWTPVASSYNSQAHTVSGQTRHLSLWSVLTVPADFLSNLAAKVLRELTGTNNTADQPHAPGESDAKQAGFQVASNAGGLVKWSLGHQDNTGLLQVADNRPFAIEVDYPSSWTVKRDDISDIDEAVITTIGKVLGLPPAGQKAIIILGGDSVTFSVPPGTTGQLSTKPSGGAYLTSALLYGVETLLTVSGAVPFMPKAETGKTLTAIKTAFDSKDCINSGIQLARNQVQSFSDATKLFRTMITLAVGCLGDQWEKAYGRGGLIGSFLVAVVAWFIDGIHLLLDGIGGAISSAIYWQGYNIAVRTPAIPVPPPNNNLVRFDGIGTLTLTMTVADLTALGYRNMGNSYEGMNPSCVSYAKTGSPSVAANPHTGQVLAIHADYGNPGPSTAIGGIHAGSTLSQLRAAFAGYMFRTYFNHDFGQGANGIVVSNGHGDIGFGLTDATISAYQSGTATINWVAGVGIPGNAPTAMETGC